MTFLRIQKNTEVFVQCLLQWQTRQALLQDLPGVNMYENKNKKIHILCYGSKTTKCLKAQLQLSAT